jgi:hypothetical protein
LNGFLARSDPQTLIAISLFFHAGAAQCTKDIDCKGDRICISGKCVEPPVPEKPSSSHSPSPCTKDTDCPGTQVCSNGVCSDESQAVSSPASPGNAQAQATVGASPTQVQSQKHNQIPSESTFLSLSQSKGFQQLLGDDEKEIDLLQFVDSNRVLVGTLNIGNEHKWPHTPSRYLMLRMPGFTKEWELSRADLRPMAPITQDQFLSYQDRCKNSRIKPEINLRVPADYDSLQNAYLKALAENPESHDDTEKYEGY